MTADGELERAAEIAAAVRLRQVSAAEMVERSLERIALRDGPVNACVRVLADQARADARRLDRGRGAPEGPLAGVPVTVKEIFAVAGERSTWGVPGLRDAPAAERDDPHVSALRAAGAVVVARTNVPELSCWGHTDNAVYGETRNPADLTRTVGGSSGGAAASVALGLAPLALGSDAGGSVRIPASFCGVVGLKPSFATLPADETSAVSRLNCAGVLTGSVAEARLALTALAGRPLEGPAPAGVRLAATVDHGFAPVDPQVRATFARALAVLAVGGVTVAEVEPPAGSPLPFVIPILECEVYEAFAELLERPDHGLAPETVAVAAIGRDTTGPQYVRAAIERLAFEAAWRAFFAGVDVLLSPTTQIPPFRLGRFGPDAIDGVPVDPTRDGAWYPTSFVANVLGAPAISIPCGATADGLPVGLQVMGRPGEDALVLSVAALLEERLSVKDQRQ